MFILNVVLVKAKKKRKKHLTFDLYVVAIGHLRICVVVVFIVLFSCALFSSLCSFPGAGLQDLGFVMYSCSSISY